MRKTATIFVAISMMAMLVGCGGLDSNRGRSSGGKADVQEPGSSQVLAAQVEKNTAFALDLYSAIRERTNAGNLIFSPHSISTALAMTYAGAVPGSETETSMRDTMHYLPQDEDQAHQAFGLLGAELASRAAATLDLGSDPRASLAYQQCMNPCTEQECGGRPLSEMLCSDGMTSVGYDTCLRNAEGTCGWKLAECPAEVADERLTLSQFNRIYVQDYDQIPMFAGQGIGLEAPFVQRMESFYDGGVLKADFNADPTLVSKQINCDVELQTNGLIKDLIPEDALKSETRVVLTNAVYFKGFWATPFDTPEPGAFDTLRESNGTVEVKTDYVDMMTSYSGEGRRYAAGQITDEDRQGFCGGGSAMFLCDEDNGYECEYDGDHPDASGTCVKRTQISYRAIELPYKRDETDLSPLSMLVIVPQGGDIKASFEAFEAAFVKSDANVLGEIVDNLDGEDVPSLAMPTFLFEGNVPLKNLLKEMGMEAPFDDDAEFQSMLVPPEGLPLKIDDVLHKARIGVDENKTEAAAATAVIMGIESAMMPPEMVIDRPFIFAIRDKTTGALLFVGRVLDPKAEEGAQI